MKRHVKASEESGFIYSEHQRFDRPNWLLLLVVVLGVILLHFCTESMAHSFTLFPIIIYFLFNIYNESHLYSVEHRTTIW